jgi:SAM-dependent methyltransferase
MAAAAPYISLTMIIPNYVPQLARGYDTSASRYRADDEIEVCSENHRRLGAILRSICREFPRPIRVLEIGCGTGRNFHCLENVELLVGTDLSAAMLKFAECPVRAKEVTAKHIRLLQGDIAAMEFPAASFDFVYALGVFGYGAKWSQELSDKAYTWLAPEGRIFFNAIEVPHCRNRMHRLKYTLKTTVYPRLPAALRTLLTTRDTVPIVAHSPAAVRTVMERSGFAHTTLSSQPCHSPLWQGVHLECFAQKGELPSSALLEPALRSSPTGYSTGPARMHDRMATA